MSGMVERVGNQHRVLVDATAGVVRRYPLRADRALRLSQTADRWRAAGVLGLPVPGVLAVRAGPVGEGHLEVAHVMGVTATGTLAGPAARRLGRGLAEVLVQMREVPREAWPSASRWVALWDAAAEVVRAEVLALLPGPVRSMADGRLEAACAAARVAPDGLCHGDLTAPNVLVTPETGALAAVLDWDEVMRGDVAGDVACLRSWLPAAATDAMVVAQPSLRGELARHDAYAATWALQGAAWALEHDEPAVLADCLDRVGSTSA